MAFEREKLHQQEEKRQAKRAERKAAKAPTAKQQAKEQAIRQKLDDAQSALRTVYRQLASALHPDRATDNDSRAHRTALMSEVNAAYGRKDLSVLLRIQLETELVDASKAVTLSDAKLKAMSDLLSEQLSAMEEDSRTVRAQMEYEYGYPSHMRFTEASFKDCLQEALDDVREDVEHMRADLLRVQDDKELKAWLKSQVRLSKAQQQDDDRMAEMLMSMGLRRF